MRKGSITCREPLGLEPLGLELGAERLGAERPQGRTNRTPTGYRSREEYFTTCIPPYLLRGLPAKNVFQDLAQRVFGQLFHKLND
jgi:hypothetical protein